MRRASDRRAQKRANSRAEAVDIQQLRGGRQNPRFGLLSQRCIQERRKKLAGVECNRRLASGARRVASDSQSLLRRAKREHHGRCDARQYFRIELSRIVRARKNLPPPLRCCNGARCIRGDADALSSGGKVTLALPTRIAFHLIARLEAVARDQAVRET